MTEQVWWHRGITDVAPGDIDDANLQCFLVDSEIYLAPDATCRVIMLAGLPFAFALTLDAGDAYCPAGHHEVMPREWIRRRNGPLEPPNGILTASVFWRRNSVLKSSTIQFKPISQSRLSTNQVVWQNATCRPALSSRSTSILRRRYRSTGGDTCLSAWRLSQSEGRISSSTSLGA